MSRLDELIEELCPDGVEYSKLGSICNLITTGKLNANAMVENGKYPFFTCDANPYRINEYAFDTTAIIISGNGSQVGHINFYKGKFNAYQRTYVLSEFNNIDVKYLLHYLKSNLKNYIILHSKKGSVPYITMPMLKNFSVPLPPLPVQQEIVRILDNFTKLTAELTARRKQYEYYRDLLLAMDDKSEVKWMTIGEIASYRRGSFPQPYGDSRWYGGINAIPFVQVADVAESGMRLNETTKQQISELAMPKSIFVPKGTVIVSLQGSIGRVAITQYDSYVDRTLAIFEQYKIDIDKRYFAYQIERKFSMEKELARGSTIKTITKEEFTKFKIPVPPIEEQERIVAILDRFDALCNDLTSGLPAELEARQKQYEYYRDKLLSFKEASS
jgi:type I restriction enzyme S subunit